MVTTIFSTVSVAATPTSTGSVNSTMAGQGHDPSSKNNANDKHSKGYWHSPGKVAGTFVVVGIVVAAIIAFAIWYFLLKPRWDQKKFEKDYNNAIGLPPATPPQNIPRTDSGNSKIYSTPIFNTHHSGSEDDSSASSNGLYNNEKKYDEHVSTSRRPNQRDVFADDAYSDYSSVPVMVDQRLDPNQMMSQIEQSPSNVSLSDDVDYSRKVLRVINEL